MTLEKLRLKVDSDGDGTIDNTYDIYPITGEISINSQKEALAIAPPDRAAADNVLLGISGMEADISIPFAVWDDGTDRSNGTAASDITTVEEQNAYLEETMHAPDFSAKWELDHLTGSAFNDDVVFVESVELTPIALESPKWKPARLRLRRGTSTV